MTNLGPLFDYGQQLRDQALSQVTSNAGSAWMDMAANLIQSQLAGREVLAEDFRLLCEQQGVVPHHHNAWGGLTRCLVRRGVLQDTGRLGSSKDPRSHSRRQPIWYVNQ